MSQRAWAYILGVLGIAATLGVTAFNVRSLSVTEAVTFAILTFLAVVAQLFEAEHGKQSFYPHFVFFIAGTFLLPPYLFVLLIAVPHIVEWAKNRMTDSKHLKAWYIQPFNIAVHIIAGMVARTAYHNIEMNSSISTQITPVMAASAAVIAYVMLNHVLVGGALVLARNISWKQSGILEFECLLPDLIMSLLGYVVAVLWEINPWFAVPALSPLVLMYRALMVPQLKQEAQTDSKTGLWNARHFTNLFTTEMERAKRFDRPLTVIMADLDLLRNINNTYGHLAGDKVLAKIGQIISENTREYDIAGRFGGEEFAIVLPETNPADALILAERLRTAVAQATVEVATSGTPIGCTMSIGLASCPWDASTLTELIHEADVAVYQAKLRGRNCVVRASDVPHSVKLEHTGTDERVKSPYAGTFTARPINMSAALGKRGSLEEQLINTAPLHPQLIGQVATTRGPELPIQANVVYTAEEGLAGAAIAAVAAEASISVGSVGSVGQSKDTQAEIDLPSIEKYESITQIAKPAPSEENQAGAAAVESTQKKQPEWVLKAFIASVISGGVLLTVLGFMLNGKLDWPAIGLLVAMAAGAELLQLDVYGDNTVSVSVALVFASAVIGGIPGVVCISAVIALCHYIQQRPAVYKTAVNWSTHIIAGAVPAVVLGVLRIPLSIDNMPILVLPVIITALAYYIIETGVIAMAIGLSRQSNVVALWRDQFRWLVNHYLVLSSMGAFLAIAYSALGLLGVIVFMIPVIMMRYSQKQYVDRTEDSMRELKRMNQELTRANQEVVSANQAMEQLNEELFLTLAKIIDARDPYVSGHASKVSDYATAIAAEMNLTPERMEPLRQAGFLHDIGKIAISEQVLHKPGRLTKEEYEYIKSHARLGGEFLELCGALRHLAPFVRHHHEWWDGNGYPDGLVGEDIPLEARILAVCDAAEAMASDRPYRRGMSLPEIIAEIKRCSGTQFDPTVAESFARVAERERDKLVVNSAHEVLRKQAFNGSLQPTLRMESPLREDQKAPMPVS